MTRAAGERVHPDTRPAGTGMVYFGMSPWLSMWKSRHQLMSRFSKKMPVLYVEPWIGLRSLRTGRTRLTRVVTDLLRPRDDHYEPNVTVFRSPAYLPVSRSKKLARGTQKRWTGAVRRAMRASGITRPIIWISKPEMAFVLGQLDEIFSIYHMVDEYAGYTGVPPAARERMKSEEAKVLDRVDLVIVASPELARAKQAPGRDILVLENGVEPDEYAHARKSDSEPADLASVPRPRIGYSGLIGNRLDLDLIEQLARNHPQYSVVLIGKVDERDCVGALAALRALPNVYLLGEKPPSMVANYIVGFDVGLLPYAINLETRHISPIKMYEYWAAGIPVVSTRIPAAERHDSAVNVATDADEFCEFVDQLIENPVVDERDRLIQLAENNSWQRRVDRVSTELSARTDVC